MAVVCWELYSMAVDCIHIITLTAHEQSNFLTYMNVSNGEISQVLLFLNVLSVTRDGELFTKITKLKLVNNYYFARVRPVFRFLSILPCYEIDTTDTYTCL